MQQSGLIGVVLLIGIEDWNFVGWQNELHGADTLCNSYSSIIQFPFEYTKIWNNVPPQGCWDMSSADAVQNAYRLFYVILTLCVCVCVCVLFLLCQHSLISSVTYLTVSQSVSLSVCLAVLMVSVKLIYF